MTTNTRTHTPRSATDADGCMAVEDRDRPVAVLPQWLADLTRDATAVCVGDTLVTHGWEKDERFVTSAGHSRGRPAAAPGCACWRSAVRPVPRQGCRPPA